MSENNAISPFLTMLGSGIFSLLVTFTTIFLNNLLVNHADKVKERRDKYQTIFQLFSDFKYQLRTLIQFIDTNETTKTVDELGKTITKIELICDNSISILIDNVLYDYNLYVDIHFKNMPKKIGNNMVLYSSNRKPDYKKETVTFEGLNMKIIELNDEMKKYLERLK